MIKGFDRVVSIFFLSALFFSNWQTTLAASHCTDWVAVVLSIQGNVEVGGADQWSAVQRDDTFCRGDVLRVGAHSRAVIRLRHEQTNIQLDQNSTLTFSAKQEAASWLDLLQGAYHFISRVPRVLKIKTPFVNAAVEGTEFLVRVGAEQTELTVFEGRVAMQNRLGELVLTSGQTAAAGVQQAPALGVTVDPDDAVQWALYYPAILEFHAAEFATEFATEFDGGGTIAPWLTAVKSSIELYGQGDSAGALAGLTELADAIDSPRVFTWRAALLISVGRVEEAEADLDRALALKPGNSNALALQSIIAVVKNEKNKALELAQQAVAGEGVSSAAFLALSYAHQAMFDLQSALDAARVAVQKQPDSGMARARLAELWLSHGELDKALQAARQAAQYAPKLARTQTVLGFAYLVQIRTGQAREAFQRAIDLDQSAPLPRLGLGLAMIRAGDLTGGRKELEVATSLDPRNALIRSYVGKAYFEESRDQIAAEQFALAKRMDPKDPTPWFYDAIRKQSRNRPVEALEDLQKSIELNDNRAVYRSRLLLDEDQAARSASLARIYQDLGFEQLALVEGWKSVNADPGNYSAHRFLADSYAALPRHEIARVSELLQAQLLQPININPIQPQLAESSLGILPGAGPSDAGFNEYNPLFMRDGHTLKANVIGGTQNTWGDDLTFSGIQGRYSYSIGQFHYETDGFRENNDLAQDIYNVFAQLAVTPKTSLQAEVRKRNVSNGDITSRFDRDDFSPVDRNKLNSELFRLGYHYTPSVKSNIIASLIYQNRTQAIHLEKGDEQFYTIGDANSDDSAYFSELRYLWRTEKYSLSAGIGYTNEDRNDEITADVTIIGTPFVFSDVSKFQFTTIHKNFYLYSNINASSNVNLTLGLSYDEYSSTDDVNDLKVARRQYNPKFGIIWSPFPVTTLRLAAFRVLKRALVSDQTIEPTNVAGFNQFFDDDNATDSTRYGIAVDQHFTRTAFGGVELSKRLLKVPIEDTGDDEDQSESTRRAYIYWVPADYLSLGVDYLFEGFGRKNIPEDVSIPKQLQTDRLSIKVNYFHARGWFARCKLIYIDQMIELPSVSGTIVSGTDKRSENYWVMNISIGYRFAKQRGIVSMGINNLFGKEFSFQDTNFQSSEPRIPTVHPKRSGEIKLTLVM